MAMYEKLFPIKIPGGWAVMHHAFGDVEPVVQDGVIVNDEFYNEDLLSIEPLRFDGTGWVVDKGGYALDLGWYPEASPDGHFRLSLIKGGWENVIVECESQDRYQIHHLIERCFELISKGLQDQEISQQIQLNQATAA